MNFVLQNDRAIPIPVDLMSQEADSRLIFPTVRMEHARPASG